ncbi:hypothetical protein [Bifidobacterium aquikefiri]|uniref:Teichoic acid transporter n=1 Tax=Bifidobacterium aquikefiri TaxID=1653207 RepID=A0A261G8T3_9BIFI|nr:hypothetical protein [Bifidobacterium aquikefiri]OZG67814.1 teichoic acid transporter [Bifidobacterium aquikefiri]
MSSEQTQGSERAHTNMSEKSKGEIPDSKLSLADIERRQSNPASWVVFIVLILVAIIAPYGFGRYVALRHTQGLIVRLNMIETPAIAVIGWIVTVVTLIALAMCVLESKSWWWRTVLIVALASEQLISGLCLLKMSFWYGTYVVFGKYAYLANAANLGVISAALGAAIFAFLFVAILVVVRKDSPLNVLTHSWSAMSLFFIIELIALSVVLFGGLLTIV